MRTGSKLGQITPAEGEAFLISAISATEPALGARKAPAKSRLSARASNAHRKSATETARCGSRATSRFFSSTILSRIVTVQCHADLGFRTSFGFRPWDLGFTLTPPHL